MNTIQVGAWIIAFLLFGSAGCQPSPPESPPARPGPCALLGARIPGPLSAEREAAGGDPLAQANLFLREAQLTGDAGFHTLAESAAACALERAPADLEVQFLHATALYHTHRFAEAEAGARALSAAREDARDHALLGDALMEQGRLDPAADAYQRAVDLRPGAALYDRIMYLRWLWGDMEGAREMAALAVSAAATEPEALAWSLAWQGWLQALSGQPAPQLDEAVALDPKLHQARLFRARLRLHQGDREGARADLDATYNDFAAMRVRRELDPGLDLGAVCDLDPRGCAVELAGVDQARAERLIAREWETRQDAMTAAARAWVLSRGGQDMREAAKAALATGSIDPDVLYLAGRVLDDPEVLKRAAATGPGLLPSQRAVMGGG